MFARLGIVGDVHAEDAALERALAWLREERAEVVLCVGDVADGYGDLERCVALLEDARALSVRGNHDRWLLADQMRTLEGAHRVASISERAAAFFSSLPATREVPTTRGTLLLCHGVGGDDMQRLQPWDEGYALTSNFALQELVLREVPLVVGGHTHRRMVRAIGATTFVNAGTLLRGHDPCAGVLDLAAGEARFLDLAREGPAAIERIPLPPVGVSSPG